MTRRGWSTAVIGVASTVVGGLATYILLIAAARALTPSAYDEFSVWWSLSLLIWLGIFMPHEQDLARNASGPERATRIATSARVSGVMIVATAVVVGGAVPLFIGLFDFAPLTVGVLLTWVIAAGFMGSVRGTLITDRRTVAVAGTIATEGLARLLLAATLVLASMTGQLVSAALPAGGITIIALLVYLVFRPRNYFTALVGPAPGWSGRVRSTLVLIVAGLGAQVLINSGPIVVRAMTSEVGQTGAFQSTFSLARIPLFLLVPLQSLLIPVFGQLIAARNTHRTRSLVLLFSLGAIAVTGVIGVLAALTGPWITGTFYGSSLVLDPVSTGLLWAAVTLYVAQTLLSQALIAAHRLVSVAIAWCIALAASIITFEALAHSGQSATMIVSEGLAAGALVGLIVATWWGVRTALTAPEKA